VTAPKLVAIDIDGTTITHEGALSARVADAVTAVVRAGHHLTIATGRSIVAMMPIAQQLGLTQGYAVCSNGAVTIRLAPDAPGGYEVTDTVTFDPRPALSLLREAIPDALVAVEDIGIGFKVSSLFPDGELGGEQTVVSWDEIIGRPATRVTLRKPEGDPEEFMAQVEAVRARLDGVAGHQPRGGEQGVGARARPTLAAGGAGRHRRHR